MKFIYTFFCDHGGDKARVFVRISLYLKNGTFREGYHFFKELKGSQSKITFVSGAIEEFKKSKER